MDNYVTIVVHFKNTITDYGFTNNILECNLTYRIVAEMILDFFHENGIRLFDVSDLLHFSMYVIDGIYIHQLFISPDDIWPLNFNKISDASLYPNLERK